MKEHKCTCPKCGMRLLVVDYTEKPKRTETRVKQPEALLKVLIDGGWKPMVNQYYELIYKKEGCDIVMTPAKWKYSGRIPYGIFKWHPSWLEEVEV